MTPYDDQTRGFPAFPPVKRKSSRGQSWWAKAWVKAMEDTALDAGLLAAGRKYAYSGHVGTITVSPGRIAASVHGNDDTPYRTVVFVERLTNAEWDRFLDQVAGKAGHIAALLDKDMPHDLVEAAEDAGVRLLPGIGDLDPECGCPEWGHPCKHAAALCYQASWLLDADPFVLLLMRGRGQRELLDELQRRNARQHHTEAPVTAAGPAPGLDPDVLDLLVANAAARARELLAADEGAQSRILDVWQDTVRMAATHPDVFARLEQVSERSAELHRAVAAWRHGGLRGLEVLEEAWTPAPSTVWNADLARVRTALADAWDGDLPELRVWRNRLTVTAHGLQLRYGRDRRWYPYRKQLGDWWPAGPPDRDLAAVLTERCLRNGG